MSEAYCITLHFDSSLENRRIHPFENITLKGTRERLFQKVPVKSTTKHRPETFFYFNIDYTLCSHYKWANLIKTDIYGFYLAS